MCRRTRVIDRLASAGVGAVIVFLAGFSLWAGAADLAALRSATIVALPLAVFVLVACALTLRASRRAELARLGHEALIDPLTRLRNRRAFEEDLERELARAQRSGEPLSLVLLDLDNLKRINDSLGHQAGDERLKLFAEAVREATRGSDVAYRIGGDEFALVLAGAAWDGAEATARRIQEELARLTEGSQRVAVGIAEAERGAERAVLVGEADAALIAAKVGLERQLTDGSAGIVARIR